jgi:hypothetical protein
MRGRLPGASREGGKTESLLFSPPGLASVSGMSRQGLVPSHRWRHLFSILTGALT